MRCTLFAALRLIGCTTLPQAVDTGSADSSDSSAPACGEAQPTLDSFASGEFVVDSCKDLVLVARSEDYSSQIAFRTTDTGYWQAGFDAYADNVSWQLSAAAGEVMLLFERAQFIPGACSDEMTSDSVWSYYPDSALVDLTLSRPFGSATVSADVNISGITYEGCTFPELGWTESWLRPPDAE